MQVTSAFSICVQCILHLWESWVLGLQQEPLGAGTMGLGLLVPWLSPSLPLSFFLCLFLLSSSS